MPVNFIHLSDIHFKKNAGTPYDATKDLRDELIRDAVSLKKTMQKFDGVLVSGDIAFSALPDEYKFAQEWLQQFCRALDIEPSNVSVIPGNHDINRLAIRESALLGDMHENLRKAAQDVDSKLANYLGKDKVAAGLLFQPLQQYNDFAGKFMCDIEPGRPFWEHDWLLDDQSILRVRGLNSTLVSDELDSDASYKLVLGRRQVELTRQDGVEYLVLCHHPPQWLLDQDAVEDLLRTRSRIQLFGHKHRQRCERIENSVRLSSGAMHPDEREPNWQPRYNALSIQIEQSPRRLRVQIFARAYSEEKTKFLPDFDENGKDFRKYEFALDEWKPTAAPVKSESAKQRPSEAKTERPECPVSAAKRLTYSFLNLPHHTKVKIANELKLVRDDDEGLRDIELFRRYFARAEESKALPALWNAVMREANQDPTPNPFLS